MKRPDSSWQVKLNWKEPDTGRDFEKIVTLPATLGRPNLGNDIEFESHIVSGKHARLERRGQTLVLSDIGSKNGTAVHGKILLSPMAITTGDEIQIGPYRITVELLTTQHDRPSRPNQHLPLVGHELRFDPLTDRLSSAHLVQPTEVSKQDQLPNLFQNEVVSVDTLAKIGSVFQTTYLTVGGGIGSFVWVNHLVVFGADRSQITAIGMESTPYGRYQRLCANSQIPNHERLRSNSDSCPDNLWGWPGYAPREMWRSFTHGRWGETVSVGRQIFREPFVQTYTPKAGNVFDSIDREATRIGWDEIRKLGRVRAIRKTDDGRYAVLYSPMNGQNSQGKQAVYLTQHLHVAVGYPGIRFLPDLQAYRRKTGDFKRVVNAYENHEAVYQYLARQGGIVLIRGRGIVASRIIQKLYETRLASGADIRILHLMRTPNGEGQRFRKSQRMVDNHWEFQPFNWPKAAWGGVLQHELEHGSPDTRSELLDQWGGTTTADRDDWREMIQTGLNEGWYEISFGNVETVDPYQNGRIVTVIKNRGDLERRTELVADYIIDATGLVSGIDSHALLKDLVACYDLPRNPKGRLAVSPSFEIEALRQPLGRVYAAGISTLGGPYAPVDSFLGLQFAALRSVDDLAALRAPGISRLNGFRSLAQWSKWAIGVTP